MSVYCESNNQIIDKQGNKNTEIAEPEKLEKHLKRAATKKFDMCFIRDYRIAYSF